MPVDEITRFESVGMFIDSPTLLNLIEGLKQHYDYVSINISLVNGIQYLEKDIDFIERLKNSGSDSINEIVIQPKLRDDDERLVYCGRLSLKRKSWTLNVQINNGKKTIVELNHFIEQWSSSAGKHFMYLSFFQTNVRIISSIILLYVYIFALIVLALNAFELNSDPSPYWIAGTSSGLLGALAIPVLSRIFPNVTFYFW